MAKPEERARRIHARLERERAEELAKQLDEAHGLARSRLEGPVDAHEHMASNQGSDTTANP